MEDDKGTVCVTGGTGYIASWLIMRLLQHGYSVRATVRTHTAAGQKKDLSYLTNLPETSKRLQIFNADLDQAGSFDKAIQGCVGVFHLAHPMDVQGQEHEETVTKRAVEGTLGILKACIESKTVKRVVYTSSAVTVLYNNRQDMDVDEDMWSDLEICRSSNLVSSSYLVSKTLTEKAALEFGERNGLEVVSLVLPLVVGPFNCPNIPSSVYIALAMIFGDESRYGYLTNSYMVHIDDATRALIFLLNYGNANGSETSDRKFSGLSSRKLLNTGFKFQYGINEMYDGAIQCCKVKGFL
ncbi:hypothetical protein SESBI_19452 [Sesbania bispinosa]|nr:hypothetical protein SESBI_19452 [Sesbania bispinosa]